MTKLKVCDISEGASRVERGARCVFRDVYVCGLSLTICACMCTGGSVSYPNGPCTDLIGSGGEEVLQLQDSVARLDDLAQGTGGETF